MELGEAHLAPSLRLDQVLEKVVLHRCVITADHCDPAACRLAPDQRLVVTDGERVLLLCGAALPCGRLRHWVY